jgi:hypothetical protein
VPALLPVKSKEVAIGWLTFPRFAPARRFAEIISGQYPLGHAEVPDELHNIGGGVVIFKQGNHWEQRLEFIRKPDRDPALSLAKCYGIFHGPLGNGCIP